MEDDDLHPSERKLPFQDSRLASFSISYRHIRRYSCECALSSLLNLKTRVCDEGRHVIVFHFFDSIIIIG